MVSRRSMRRSARALPVLLLLLPVGVVGQQRYNLGGSAAIYDLVGEVRVVSGGGSSIVAEVRPQGNDARQLRVQTGPVGGWQTLRVVFPEDRVVYDRPGWRGNTSLDVRGDGTFGDDRFWRDEARQAGPGGSSHRVSIGGSGSGVHAHADLVIQVPAGRHVAVFLGVGHVDVTNVDGSLWVSTSSGDVALDRVRGTLHASTGSGDLKMTGLEGDVSASTGSGDVTLDGARSGTVRISTGSGDLRGGSIAGPSLEASTGSGNLELRNVSVPRARLSAGSGDINVALVAALEEVTVHTGSGDVTLGLPASADTRVHLSTGSGDVDTDLPIRVTTHRDHSLVGTIGNGRGALEISTGSGDVHLTRN